ncbi:SMI1/KNR4 family protein [Flavobacterium rhizosphaerae]|uniref:SMI1/KNR4 family protein n=1 Tax=Flavobacterium rhizosphaerae TaxID=3163298 RepID=A0ABW8YYC4_9FLAO
MKIDKAFEIIENNIEEAFFTGKINRETINTASSLLGVTFPDSYSRFLEKYGCGDIYGVEIYGIVSDDNVEGRGIPSVVWLTKELRKDGVEYKFIPVSDTGDGGYYVLDTSKISDGECPVVIVEPGSTGWYEDAYENFGAFLLDSLEQSDLS